MPYKQKLSMRPPSGLLRADNSSKSSYREVQRLIHEEWTSQGELKTALPSWLVSGERTVCTPTVRRQRCS